MKKNVRLLVSGLKELVWYLFQVVMLSGGVVLFFKWSGALLEPICEHVNVGIGLFVIFAVVAVFIYIDNRNSVEEKQRDSEQNYRRKQAVR